MKRKLLKVFLSAIDKFLLTINVVSYEGTQEQQWETFTA